MELNIKHRGKAVKLSFTISEDTTLGQLRHEIAFTIGSDVTKTKLLSSGKQFVYTSSSSNDENNQENRLIYDLFKPKATVIVMASTSTAIETASSTSLSLPKDHRFLNDDNRDNIFSSGHAPRFIATPSKTTRRNIRSGDENYGFMIVESLKSYADHKKAQAVLERLANDEGILSVMRMKKWKVGALREMIPKGRVGIDTCLMGYNVGRGQEIRLRLRTDDGQGFRSISQLLQVLAHELAHNVEDGHGIAFKETMREIERHIQHKDWRGTGGRYLGDGENAKAISMNEIANSTTELNDGDGGRHGGRLGGGGGVSRLILEAERQQREGQSEKETKNDKHR